MSPDPKLIEAVAKAIWDCDAAGPIRVSAARLLAKEVLAAISASGEWWVAPWHLSDEEKQNWVGFAWWWQEFRNAHLKDTGTDDGG